MHINAISFCLSFTLKVMGYNFNFVHVIITVVIPIQHMIQSNVRNLIPEIL